MAQTTEEYKGRTISVEPQQRVGAGWHWTYQIDQGPIRTSEDHALPTEELALKEGLEHAKREIDGR